MNPMTEDGRYVVDNKSFTIENMASIMHSNKIFSPTEIDKYYSFNRYGWINPYDIDQVTREFLFFTKPDLYIFDHAGNDEDYINSSMNAYQRNIAMHRVGSYSNEVINYENAVLQKNLKNIPYFREEAARYKKSLAQLQYSVRSPGGDQYPFMTLLSNAVTSKLDLPGISADTNTSTSNIYGVSMDYRSHSFKSDNGYDFTLSITDTPSLEIYHMVKSYDLYFRMLKMGEIGRNTHFTNLIISHIIPEQFSVYKFLIGSDGETILYFAKATGVYFTDVPRSDFGDPSDFKYSLSFHANDVKDNDPLILSEFNTITPAATTGFLPVHDENGINNEWAKYPRVIRVTSDTDGRAQRRNLTTDYRLKWTNVNKGVSSITTPSRRTTTYRNRSAFL